MSVKEGKRMLNPKVDIILKILPFGNGQIELKGQEESEEPELGSRPRYGEPRTTNQEIIEVMFGGGDFIVPKTTGGDF